MKLDNNYSIKIKVLQIVNQEGAENSLFEWVEYVNFRRVFD